MSGNGASDSASSGGAPAANPAAATPDQNGMVRNGFGAMVQSAVQTAQSTAPEAASANGFGLGGAKPVAGLPSAAAPAADGTGGFGSTLGEVRPPVTPDARANLTAAERKRAPGSVAASSLGSSAVITG